MQTDHVVGWFLGRITGEASIEKPCRLGKLTKNLLEQPIFGAEVCTELSFVRLCVSRDAVDASTGHFVSSELSGPRIENTAAGGWTVVHNVSVNQLVCLTRRSGNATLPVTN